MSERSFYYRTHDDGSVERLGPFPSNGDWPAKYAARGLFLTPQGVAPAEQPSQALETLAAVAGIETEGRTAHELVQALTAVLEAGAQQTEDQEIPDFKKLGADELKALAGRAGIEVGSMKKGEIAEELGRLREEASRVVSLLGFVEPEEDGNPAA